MMGVPERFSGTPGPALMNEPRPILALRDASKAFGAIHALEHVSIELYPGFRDFAREDSDFDPVRDEPAIKELMGVSS